MTAYQGTHDQPMINKPEPANRAGLDKPPSGPSGRPIERDRVRNQRRLHRWAPRPGRRRPTSTFLLRLAVVVVIAAFVASLVGLVVYAPNGGDEVARRGLTLAAGVLGLYTAMAGQVLGFIAAVRSGDTE